MPLSNKQLFEPMLTQIYVPIWRHQPKINLFLSLHIVENTPVVKLTMNNAISHIHKQPVWKGAFITNQRPYLGGDWPVG